jgi:hypothetical protein
MRADREALIAMTDYGPAAAFHLVIPAYSPLVMDHPIAFADELLPLVVTGGRHRGTDLVWFALRRYPNEERLQCARFIATGQQLLVGYSFCQNDPSEHVRYLYGRGVLVQIVVNGRERLGDILNRVTFPSFRYTSTFFI